MVQHGCEDDFAVNMERSISGIRSAADQGAQLVLLQELHGGPYFCQAEDSAQFARAETIPGVTTERLGELARQIGVVIVASLFERRATGIYHNTAVVLDRDGQIRGRYRKMHIPDDPGYHEKYYFTPGDGGFLPITTSVGRLGVLVCWDQWFPEAARLQALAGAEILLYPTAIGWNPPDDTAEKQRQLDAWRTIQRAHAVANSLPVMCCNRTGFESIPTGPGIEFWGSSFICGPQGEILAQGPADRQEVIVTEIDLARSERLRREWPFLRDRRIDAYSGLTQRYLDMADT